MHHIAIDPLLLCLPNPCHSEAAVERFVNNLLSWREGLRRTNLRLFLSDLCIEALINDAEYPYEYRLRDALNQYEVDVADHETVCQLLRDILKLTPSLAEVCGVTSVLFDDALMEVEPAFFLGRLPAHTKSAFAQTLVMLSARCLCGHTPHDDFSIASYIDESLLTDSSELTIISEVHEIECYDPSRRSNCVFPVKLRDVFDIYSSHNDFLMGIDILDLWAFATTEQGARDAIDILVNELVQQGSAEASQVITYAIGQRFLDSARKWGFGARSDYAMVLIESCARIVIGQPKNHLEPFRINANPGSRQRTRADGALAFRTHLTKRGPGFRLMLWETSGGEIEFANVGDKDELEIY
jgi:hypothetical protein